MLVAQPGKAHRIHRIHIWIYTHTDTHTTVSLIVTPTQEMELVVNSSG